MAEKQNLDGDAEKLKSKQMLSFPLKNKQTVYLGITNLSS